MTTSSTKIDELHSSRSDHTEDIDWVMVKEEGHLTKEDFEMIDAAEARCWCGGADAERCRLQGHTWPLCDIDQDDVWSELPREHYQPYQEATETKSSNSTGDDSATEHADPDVSKEPREKPAEQSIAHPLGVYKSGPFTKLAVLTEILETGKYPKV